jgi:hypothetical protein
VSSRALIACLIYINALACKYSLNHQTSAKETAVLTQLSSEGNKFIQGSGIGFQAVSYHSSHVFSLTHEKKIDSKSENGCLAVSVEHPSRDPEENVSECVGYASVEEANKQHGV